MRRILICPIESATWCVCDGWDGVGQMIEEDGCYEVRFKDMTEDEVDALGEFPGW